MFQVVRFPFYGLAEISDHSSVVCAIGFDEIVDERIFLLKSTTIEVKGMCFTLIQHYNNRRVAAKLVMSFSQ